MYELYIQMKKEGIDKIDTVVRYVITILFGLSVMVSAAFNLDTKLKKGPNYIIVKSIVPTGDPSNMYKVELILRSDSLFTNRIYKPGDTIYFNKIRIR